MSNKATTKEPRKPPFFSEDKLAFLEDYMLQYQRYKRSITSSDPDPEPQPQGDSENNPPAEGTEVSISSDAGRMQSPDYRLSATAVKLTLSALPPTFASRYLQMAAWRVGEGLVVHVQQ